MSEAIVTKAWLATYIANQPREKVGQMIGRALVALYNRQTLIERCGALTLEANNQGFASCDANSGSKTAKSYLKYGRLLDWQVEAWTRPCGKSGLPRICRYDRQLNEVALQKARK